MQNDVKNEKIKELKDELIQKYISRQIMNWRLEAIPFIIGIVLIIFFFFFEIFYSEWEYNYVNKFIIWIDNNGSDTKKETLRWFINGGLVTILQWGIRVCGARLFSKSKYKLKKEEIKQNIPEKYK